MTVGAMRASPTVVVTPSFLGSGSVKESPLLSSTLQKNMFPAMLARNNKNCIKRKASLTRSQEIGTPQSSM
jgi:hypothetical protein